uniref:Uncharacterized protein n=1 Tax=Beihai narna-like virus 5 TaxID=1922457 RepID=A0A1L3KI42_9VIRU|nr:hypothetical protein [Beihai narna-like virus 5]
MQKARKDKSRNIKTALDKHDRDEMEFAINSIRRGHGLSPIAEAYLLQMVDCTTRKPVGTPSLLGGVPGNTEVYRLKQELRVTVGQNGYGFLVVNYSDTSDGSLLSGPFNDVPVFSYSTIAFTGTSLPARGAPISATPGVRNEGWTLSPLQVSTFGTAAQTEYSWRCVAAIAECTNTTAVLEQEGSIVLWEPPNHASLNANGGYNMSTIQAQRTARVVRAQNGADHVDKVALNWHPKMLETYLGSESSDFAFSCVNAPPTLQFSLMPSVKDGVMVFQGSPGNTFHVTVSCIYEAKGSRARGVKPRLTDEHGMNIVFNVLAAKSLDGYAGNPRRIADGYLAKAWEVAKRLGSSFIKESERRIMSGAGSTLKTLAGIE